MSKTVQVDVAIIGAGTAGLTARRAAKKNGASVVLIESGPYGTTCARVGCMPSKLLIQAADIVHELSFGEKIGIELPSAPVVNGRAVLERVQRERDRFVGFVVDAVESLPAEEKLRGHARFIGPTTLMVDDHTKVQARSIVIATGTTPIIPRAFAAAGDRLLTNENIFELEMLPSSIAVVGTGVIGLELGQSLHRLGVRTTLFSNTAILGPLSDPMVQQSAREIMGAELDLRLEVNITGTEKTREGVLMRWRDKAGGEHERSFERLLVAAGRKTSLARMDIEAAGVEVDARGLPIHDRRTLQCGDLPIFVAGDVTGNRPLLHEAADEGRLAGANAARHPQVRAQVRRTPLTIVFSDPQMAMVGQSYARLNPEDVAIGQVDYGAQGRARVMGKNAGIVRIYADRDCDFLLGAEMFGPRVEHTAHLLAWAVQQRMTVDKALEMPFYHPVVEEGIRTALQDLAAKLKLQEKREKNCLDCGPGA